MNRTVQKRSILLIIAATLCILSPLRAQKIYIDTIPDVKSLVFSYNFGVTGYASSKGISAWDAGNKSSGIANSIKFMYYSSTNDIGYGVLLYGNSYSEKFRTEDMKERGQMIYIAPQVAYLKRTVAFEKCFGTVGGGVGYLSYQSKSKFPNNQESKSTCSSVGVNGFINFEYTFAKHWGVNLEVNALYVPLSLKYDKIENLSSLKHRNKFSSFLLSTQIGISCHL